MPYRSVFEQSFDGYGNIPPFPPDGVSSFWDMDQPQYNGSIKLDHDSNRIGMIQNGDCGIGVNDIQGLNLWDWGKVASGKKDGFDMLNNYTPPITNLATGDRFTELLETKLGLDNQNQRQNDDHQTYSEGGSLWPFPSSGRNNGLISISGSGSFARGSFGNESGTSGSPGDCISGQEQGGHSVISRNSNYNHLSGPTSGSGSGSGSSSGAGFNHGLQSSQISFTTINPSNSHSIPSSTQSNYLPPTTSNQMYNPHQGISPMIPARSPSMAPPPLSLSQSQSLSLSSRTSTLSTPITPNYTYTPVYCPLPQTNQATPISATSSDSSFAQTRTEYPSPWTPIGQQSSHDVLNTDHHIIHNYPQVPVQPDSMVPYIPQPLTHWSTHQIEQVPTQSISDPSPRETFHSDSNNFAPSSQTITHNHSYTYSYTVTQQSSPLSAHPAPPTIPYTSSNQSIPPVPPHLSIPTMSTIPITNRVHSTRSMSPAGSYTASSSPSIASQIIHPAPASTSCHAIHTLRPRDTQVVHPPVKKQSIQAQSHQTPLPATVTAPPSGFQSSPQSITSTSYRSGPVSSTFSLTIPSQKQNPTSGASKRSMSASVPRVSVNQSIYNQPKSTPENYLPQESASSSNLSRNRTSSTPSQSLSTTIESVSNTKQPGGSQWVQTPSMQPVTSKVTSPSVGMTSSAQRPSPKEMTAVMYSTPLQPGSLAIDGRLARSRSHSNANNTTSIADIMSRSMSGSATATTTATAVVSKSPVASNRIQSIHPTQMEKIKLEYSSLPTLSTVIPSTNPQSSANPDMTDNSIGSVVDSATPQSVITNTATVPSSLPPLPTPIRRNSSNASQSPDLTAERSGSNDKSLPVRESKKRDGSSLNTVEENIPDTTDTSSGLGSLFKKTKLDTGVSLSFNAKSISQQLDAVDSSNSNGEGDSTSVAAAGFIEEKKPTIACHSCRSKKLKCNGARPKCHHCTRRGETSCVYDTVVKRRGPGKHNKPKKSKSKGIGRGRGRRKIANGEVGGVGDEGAAASGVGVEMAVDV